MKDRDPIRSKEHHRGKGSAALLGLAVIAAACSGGGNESDSLPPDQATILTTNLPETGSSLPESLPSPPKKVLSLSSMNQSKDRVCNQRPPEWIDEWVGLAKDLGVSHVGLETPYDNPRCEGDTSETPADDYTKEWVDAIHAAGLGVWHRHMFTQFEGIYNAKRTPGMDWPGMIKEYISTHPDLFQDGDIVTPMAEPFGGGVQGVTGCPDNVCMFDTREEYEATMMDSYTAAVDALQEIGKPGVTVTGSNENGFSLWGAQNPDHEGRRQDSLVTDKMLAQGGLVVVDHGPPPGITMQHDLDVLHRTFPDMEYMVGEWSPTDRSDTIPLIHETLDAIRKDPFAVGFQYFQGGPTDSQYEGLFDEVSGHLQMNAKGAAVKEEFAQMR